MAPINKIEIELTVLVGEAELPLKRLLRMGRGAFIPLGGDERKLLEIRANGRKIADGQVVLQRDRVAVRLDDGAAAAG